MAVRYAKRFTFETSVSVVSAAPPEVVYDAVADLRTHLDWAGERAASDTFKLLSLEGPDGPATEGAVFTSTGANDNGTFHDRSVVTEASRPTVSPSRRMPAWSGPTAGPGRSTSPTATTSRSEGGGSRIVYTDTVREVNYVPYWLQAWCRPISRRLIARADTETDAGTRPVRRGASRASGRSELRRSRTAPGPCSGAAAERLRGDPARGRGPHGRGRPGAGSRRRRPRDPCPRPHARGPRRSRPRGAVADRWSSPGASGGRATSTTSTTCGGCSRSPGRRSPPARRPATGSSGSRARPATGAVRAVRDALRRRGPLTRPQVKERPRPARRRRLGTGADPRPPPGGPRGRAVRRPTRGAVARAYVRARRSRAGGAPRRIEPRGRPRRARAPVPARPRARRARGPLASWSGLPAGRPARAWASIADEAHGGGRRPERRAVDPVERTLGSTSAAARRPMPGAAAARLRRPAARLRGPGRPLVPRNRRPARINAGGGMILPLTVLTDEGDSLATWSSAAGARGGLRIEVAPFGTLVGRHASPPIEREARPGPRSWERPSPAGRPRTS